VAEDGTLCVGTADGYVHSLNGDGSFRWSHTVQGAVERRPLHVGSHWYVTAGAGRIFALTPEGTLAWVFKPPSEVNSELSADVDGTAYFIGVDRFLYGLSQHGGVTLRARVGPPSAGPERGPDGAIWLKNAAGEVFRARGQRVRRWASAERSPVVFSDPLVLTDPEGHLWQWRPDGVLEFRSEPSGARREVSLTRSPLLAPIWSSAAHYAVFSARSGLVFAMDPAPPPHAR